MVTRILIQPGRYYDSVTLMTLSQRLAALPGVVEAVAIMGTPMNRELLDNVGLLTMDAAAAGPSDLVIAVGADTAAHAASAVAAAERMLGANPAAAAGARGAHSIPGAGHAHSTPGAEHAHSTPGAGGAHSTPGAGGAHSTPGAGHAHRTPGPAATPPRTIAAAVRITPTARLAFISVPGPYAAREARLALEHDLDVMLYSDNVPVDAEVRLKRLAHDRGRLLMGPDCGTAIIDGVGLGFANAVRPGHIGIVAACGTGAQELSCLIDRLGAGISTLIGTGGRDGSAEVGGRMLLDGLARLQSDPATHVIVVIAKPPAPAVAESIQTAARAGYKPTVVCFLNGEGTLCIDEAAVRAVHLATGQPEADLTTRLGARLPGRPIVVPGRPIAAPGWPTPAPGLPPGAIRPARTEIRGLFAGGSLCEQARNILKRAEPKLIDLGADAFTTGRPHPIIDATLRRRHLRQASADPRTAVILLDIVIGYGAHPDPAGALAGEIRAAAARGIAVVASVTGTESDPQGLSAQASLLREAGAAVLPTARRAAEYVLEVMARG